MVKADELVKEQQERDKEKTKLFKKVYKLAEKKIINCSKINLYQCIFEIPHFVLNVPLYSIDNCKNYIIERLKTNGFKVEILNQNTLLIKWG